MLMFGSGASTYGSTSLGRQPVERGHRNTVPAGHHRPGVSPAISEAVHAANFTFSHSKTVPSVQMQCRMTASFPGEAGQGSLRRIDPPPNATCAFFMPTRFARRTPQAFSAHQRFVR